MPTHLDRRSFLAALSGLPALALAPKLAGQVSAGQQIRTRGINHVKLIVADLKRSIDFYQGLFGMPVQARGGSSEAALRIGSGPQHLALSNDADATPSIESYCLGVEGFNEDQILKTLAAHGIKVSEYRGAMTVQVGTRGDRTDIYLNDPDGLIVQLQDVSYCGGGGRLGASCTAVEPSPKKGLISLKGYSHITVFSGDAQRSNDFYKQLFGLTVRSFQGPTAPTLAVGPTVEFLMFTGGAAGRGGAPRPASINHFCLNLDGFNADAVIKTLESYGIKPRESQTGPVGPMRHYISMRMENRGGAKEGTPELYFTDPDGILVQLQDVKYCGGSGALGDVCPKV